MVPEGSAHRPVVGREAEREPVDSTAVLGDRMVSMVHIEDRVPIAGHALDSLRRQPQRWQSTERRGIIATR